MIQMTAYKGEKLIQMRKKIMYPSNVEKQESFSTMKKTFVMAISHAFTRGDDSYSRVKQYHVRK